MFGSSELLASIGGFLSLLGGISVISLFEVFYFLGCRNVRKNRKFQEIDLTNDQEEVKEDSKFCLFLKNHCKFSSIHGLNNALEGRVFG